jgi:prolipoprotein diacylglyceryltransferase
LLWIARRFAAQLKRGDLILLYFVISPVGRIITELFRLDSVTVLSLSLAQALSALMVVVALIIVLIRHRARPSLSAPATISTGKQSSQ